jgi:hypothetical protein
MLVVDMAGADPHADFHEIFRERGIDFLLAEAHSVVRPRSHPAVQAIISDSPKPPSMESVIPHISCR